MSGTQVSISLSQHDSFDSTSIFYLNQSWLFYWEPLPWDRHQYLKIVAVNFLILALVCTLWFFGIFALLIYSVILFCILRKYFDDLRGKYAVLLNITNQMAEGNLDIEIEEDLGIFNPFKQEIRKIQDGYQKAVEKEVKSQRMRTELVTNVSHDLKTPLTAIITYVNLLKEEKDEEKRKEV